MSKTVKIRRGANIKLVGAAEKTTSDATIPSSFAIKPSDFHGMVPKMLLKEGAEVKAGTPIFYDKKNERIKFVSPVSGEIAEIVRGAKRRILEVRIVADKEQKHETGNPIDITSLDKAKMSEVIMDAGLWPFIKRRPYDIIADPTEAPKSIFISGFDSAPLGVDMDYILEGREADFQKGVDALSKLTEGKVHVNVQAGSGTFMANSKNAQVNTISGPHPAGLPGIQIHHIDPINKGDVVWVVGAQEAAIIGRYLNTGRPDFSKRIALAGSEVKKPRYFNTWIGANVQSVIEGQLNDGDIRIIDGNVLTGTQLTPEGYIGFYSNMVSVIPEGREPQFLGWIAPNLHKFSLSHSYFSWLMPSKKYELNTNMNGEDRAFVMSGQYEDVLPMDIYPVHLIKAIMTNDIEKMEALGIYEVAPEDLALCEYACTSKTEVQRLIRQGIDTAIEELG
ncbi:MAG: Na(+)-translocating NADH-quinone reductase subunit A [Salibacteraceae bacterium]